MTVLEDNWDKRLKKENASSPQIFDTSPKVDLDNLAFACTSSGTTGKPKGMLMFGHWKITYQQALNIMRHPEFYGHDVILMLMIINSSFTGGIGQCTDVKLSYFWYFWFCSAFELLGIYKNNPHTNVCFQLFCIHIVEWSSHIIGDTNITHSRQTTGLPVTSTSCGNSCERSPKVGQTRGVARLPVVVVQRKKIKSWNCKHRGHFFRDFLLNLKAKHTCFFPPHVS